MIAPNGTLVMYSAALSSVMSDNGGDHGLFVQELLKEIRVPDLMAEETLNRTRVGVTRASRSRHRCPGYRRRWRRDFSFIPGARPTSLPPTACRRNSPTTARAAHRPSRAAKGRDANPAAAREASGGKPSNQRASPPPPQPRWPTTPAIKSLTAKLVENPDDAGSLYRRGQVYASKGAYDLAIKDFGDTIRLNPKDVGLLLLDVGCVR